MAELEIYQTHQAHPEAHLQLNQFVKAEIDAGNTRDLTFISKELGREINLLLMFDPPKVGVLFTDLFPVAWKVLSFSATGVSSAYVEYTSSSGFFVPQIQSGNRVAASNAQPCETGQRCTLMTNNNGNGNYVTGAVPGVSGSMQCTNLTERPASIGIGFFNDTGHKMEPALLWDNIAKNSTLSVQLTPRLKIYAVSDYRATELIRGNIESPLLFEKNLISLPFATEWRVFIDEGTGEVKIEASG